MVKFALKDLRIKRGFVSNLVIFHDVKLDFEAPWFALEPYVIYVLV
jgi:hypothetical protein